MEYRMSSFRCLKIVTICFGISGCTPYDSPHLSDAVLIINFTVNKNDFENLVAQLRSDCKKGLYRVAIDWTEPDNPKTIAISESQIAHYRKLFGTLGIKRGYSAVSDCRSLEFITSTQGLAVSGSSKGYMYSESQPGNIVVSLDEYKPSFKYGAYRQINDHWYLFYSE